MSAAPEDPPPDDDLAELRGARRFTATLEWADERRAFLLGLAPHARSLYERGGPAVHFDLEGRWTRAALADGTYLRGLDGRVLSRFGPHGNETLDLARRREVHAAVAALARAAADAPGAPEAMATLAGWGVERLERESLRFLEAYRPVGIVPPDRYRSLIIQATEGCAWNGCAFCSLYLKQRARVRSLDELALHVARVKAFVGSGIAARRGIFLGEANALATPQPTLVAMLELVARELPDLVRGDRPGGGVASFIDAFTEQDKGPEDYAALRERGLARVFLGVESGDEDVLAFLRKPATRAGVAATVAALKGGGLSVGVILLVGAGGARWSVAHVERSASLVHALALDRGDVVYLSPLVAEPGGRFDRAASKEGLELLAPDALVAEEQALRAALAGTPAQVARYDVSRFVYA